MARSIRSNKLETRTSRLKLEVKTYFVITIGESLSIRYRRPTTGNGTWQVRIRAENKYIHHVIGEADDYIDANGDNILSFYQAQEKCRLFSAEAKQPSLSTGKPITVKQASQHYMDWFREYRKSVQDAERTINAHILPALGNKLVMDLTALEIRNWHEKLASSPPRRRTRVGAKQNYGEKPSSSDGKRSRKSTANRILTVLKAILNKAFEDGLASDDKEWRRVKPFKQTDEPVTRFLTVAESTRLINACKPDFRLMVQAALLTGCRYGEITRILVTHVNLETGLIYITSESKGDKGRHVPLSEEGLNFFREQIIGKTGMEYAFKRSDGTCWNKNHQSRLMKAACLQAKIEPAISFHELRHTYASLLAQAGADLLTISKLLGHADTRITSRHYAHLCDKTLANTVRNLLPDFGSANTPSNIVTIYK